MQYMTPIRTLLLSATIFWGSDFSFVLAQTTVSQDAGSPRFTDPKRIADHRQERQAIHQALQSLMEQLQKETDPLLWRAAMGHWLVANETDLARLKRVTRELGDAGSAAAVAASQGRMKTPEMQARIANDPVLAERLSIQGEIRDLLHSRAEDDPMQRREALAQWYEGNDDRLARLQSLEDQTISQEALSAPAATTTTPGSASAPVASPSNEAQTLSRNLMDVLHQAVALPPEEHRALLQQWFDLHEESMIRARRNDAGQP